ncbi:MAG TPA: kelch repeat-containing protein [Kofleriaceae bacterium]|nr:kelch repeat-containing protein [Kofleriaceae bacterium]
MCPTAHGVGPVLVLIALAACGSDVRTIELTRIAPAADPACGAPTDGRTLIVTALGDFPPSEATGRPVNLSQVDQASTFSIDSFPAGTRVLELVVIGGGGVTRTIGRTAELELEALEDGAALPVFMAPPRGFCRTGNAVGTPRRAPLMARAGADVLIAGGFGEGDAPVNEVQLYRAADGSMMSLGDALYGDNDSLGLAGASMTTLLDGRVVVAGGPAPAYQVFDPGEGTFRAPGFLAPDPRAYHAAVALSASQVLLAGGCDELDAAGACVPGSTLAATSILDIDRGTVQPGPTLLRARHRATAFLDADGRVVIVGGVDDGGPVDTAERLDLTGTLPGEVVDGAGGLGARLPDGGLLAALAPADGIARSDAAVVPQGGGAASAVASAPGPRAGATLTTLEDGRVLVLGGLDAAGGNEALLYEPQLERFELVEAMPDAGAGAIHRRDHGAVRLADGSVLIVGGRDAGGAVLDDAWIFRPDLTGAFTGDATISFGVAAAGLSLVPRDPQHFRLQPAGAGIPATAVLDSSGGGGALPSEWALVAGPRFVGLSLEVRVGATGGGAALLIGFADAGRYAAAVLIPGQSAQLYDVVGGIAVLASECDGELIEAGDLGSPTQLVSLGLEAREHELEVTAGERVVLRCSERDEPARGLAGLGVVGASGASLHIASISIGR